MSNTEHGGFEPSSLIREHSAAGQWALDASASRVEFGVKHFWGLITVHGGFQGLDGSADVADDGRVSAALRIDAASIDSKQRKRDEHLRSDDFFGAAKNPQVEARIDAVTLTSPTTGTARGQLTAAGHSEPVSFDATIALSPDGRQATVDAGFDVDRTRFGMTWSPMHIAAATAHITAHLVFRHGANQS